jgi:hypothetical protein
VVANIHLKLVSASIQLEVEVAVAATSEAARLRETLPTESLALDLWSF